MITLAPATIAAAVAALSLGGSAGALTRVQGGLHTNVYVVPAAGGHPTRLTKNPAIGEDRLAYDPSWSPSGKRMVFTEVLCHFCSGEIHVMPAHPTRGTIWIRQKIGNGFHPRWSPDGRHIVYVGVNGGIYMMRPDGSGRRLLAKGGLADDGPSWSPDSRRIVFTQQLTSTRWRLYVVGADGSGLHPLSSGAAPAINPSWSPNGRRIAFAQQQGTGRWQIFTMNLDGSDRRKVSDGRSSDSFPVWSPNGRRLAFVRQEGNANAVFTIAVNGRGPRRASPRSLNAVEPAWSPRGARIAFAADARA